ncbi:MAG: serine/threonine protein kinase [Planctomycetota bacterium]|nr:MAG: serine/threonine protein kinase [Planctomycetota bacterium]
MPRLVVEKGVDKGKSIQVGLQGAVVVGRDTSAGITINDTMASRNHFKVEARTGSFVLVDLNSKNGTLLNGSRVKESKIVAGDRVQVGETVFSFMEDVKPKEDLIGRIIGGGRYKVIDRVGRGGMGTVYKAEQIRLNRNVALKMLQQELVSDPTFIKKFLDEARAAAQFNHPNVVTIYEIDVANDLQPPVPFIAMEYLPGGSVQDLLSREKKLPPDRALAVILDAARGLEYAEKKSIVHRDIKPDNLMISEDGRIKIGDLGLAKQLKADGARPESPEGVFGTPHYIAPEQALNKPIDIRADIYSLGATFYRILAGTTPYQGSSAKEIVVNKLREEPPPLDIVDPGLPKILTAIVDKMMRRNPDERHLTAKELVADLDRARREVAGSLTGPLSLQVDPASASSSATATAMGGEARRSATPVVVLTGAAAMLIITVAVVAATLIKNNNADPGPVGPGPGPVEGNGDQGNLEMLANKALGNAEMIEKNADMSSPESIQRVVDSYAQIVKEYPGTTAEEKAKSQVDFYQKLLTTLAGDAVFGLAERKEVAFTTARKSFAQEKSKFEEVVRHAEDAMAAFGDFVNKFPDDQRVDLALKRSGAIDAELSAFRSSHTAWQAESKAIGEFLNQKAFGEAETKLAAADKSAEFRDYAGAIKFLREKLRRDAEREFATLSDQAEQKKRDNDFAGARLLVDAGRAWGFGDLKKRWDDVSDSIDRAEEDFKGAEAKKVREEQVAALREGRVRAIDGLRNRFGFAAAAAAIDAALPRIKDKDLADEAAALLSDYKAAAALHVTLLTRSADGRLKPKTKVAFNKINMDGELTKATAENISFKESATGATVSISWKDLQTIEYRQVMRTWDYEWEDARGLVAVDVALGLWKEAETDISAAERLAASGHQADLAAMRARLAWVRASGPEQEAQDRLEQAREEMKRGKWQRALDDLNEIATRLNSTKYYGERRATVDAMQDECKDKLKK